LPQALYVLGEALGGGLGQHGWVEIDDLVFDGVLQEFYSKSGYYELALARPWYRFDRKATMWVDRLRSRQKGDLNTYRFDHLLRLPWADYSNPQTLDLDLAKRYLKATATATGYRLLR
jgi:hypothetical protein